MPKLKIIFCIPALILSFHPGYPALAQQGTAKTATAAVSGRVTDPGGRPLSEELLSLFRLDKDGEWRQFSDPPNASEMFRTNDRGIYRIFGLPDGRYIISAGYEELSAPRLMTNSAIARPRRPPGTRTSARI